MFKKARWWENLATIYGLLGSGGVVSQCNNAPHLCLARSVAVGARDAVREAWRTVGDGGRQTTAEVSIRGGRSTRAAWLPARPALVAASAVAHARCTAEYTDAASIPTGLSTYLPFVTYANNEVWMRRVFAEFP